MRIGFFIQHQLFILSEFLNMFDEKLELSMFFPVKNLIDKTTYKTIFDYGQIDKRLRIRCVFDGIENSLFLTLWSAPVMTPEKLKKNG